MTTDYKGALNEMFDALQTAWLGANAIVGYAPRIYFPGEDDGTIPDAALFWARVSTNSVLCEQSTLCENVVTQGSKRFETFGLIFFQIFAPKRADSEDKTLLLSALVQNCFRNRTANVILRNARIKEVSPENGAIRKIVVAEFQFDEVN